MEVAEAPTPSTALAAPALPPLLLSAKLFSADGKMLVTLLELSATHAVATTTAPPPAGSIAVLSRCGARVPAEIAWVDGQRMGLLFDQPPSEGLLRLLAG